MCFEKTCTICAAARKRGKPAKGAITAVETQKTLRGFRQEARIEVT